MSRLQRFLPKPIYSRKELKEKCETLLRELTYKAETYYGVPITFIPKVVVVRARRYYARIVQPKLNVPLIRVNQIFIDFYKADPILAEKALRFTLAHEVAHIVQRKQYGVGDMMLSHPLAIEEDANKKAEHISGITFEEFHDTVMELHEKIGASPKPLAL